MQAIVDTMKLQQSRSTIILWRMYLFAASISVICLLGATEGGDLRRACLIGAAVFALLGLVFLLVYLSYARDDRRRQFGVDLD